MSLICKLPQRDYTQATVYIIKILFLKLYNLWIVSRAQPGSYKRLCPPLPVNEKTSSGRKR